MAYGFTSTSSRISSPSESSTPVLYSNSSVHSASTLSEPKSLSFIDAESIQPNLLSFERSPTKNEPFNILLSVIKFKPEPAVADKRNPCGDVLVIKFTEPPRASASISGVTALLTSMVWIISEGIKSICMFLLSPSADGILLPFKVTELSCGDKPRTMIFLASP